jgi:hypothetical protein
MFLQRHPQSEVVVRDVQSSVQTVIGWKNSSAFSSDLVALPQSSAVIVSRSN